MSLINDALKRASQIKPPPSTTAEPETPLRAVDYGHHHRLLQNFLPVILVLVLALAGWFFVKSWQAGHAGNLPAYKIPVQARELPPEPAKSLDQLSPASARTVERVAAKSGPQAVTSATAVLTPSESPIRDPADSQSALHKPLENAAVPAVEPPQTNVAAAFTEPPKPTFPPVRLQGFIYRAQNPSVILNAKTLRVGDKLGSVKVLAITRDSVTLQWNGETKVLTLEE